MIPRGCNLPKKATIIAVKPQLGEISLYNKPIGPDTSANPAIPAKAQQIPKSKYIKVFLLNPAYLAAVGLKPETFN